MIASITLATWDTRPLASFHCSILVCQFCCFLGLRCDFMVLASLGQPCFWSPTFSSEASIPAKPAKSRLRTSGLFCWSGEMG